MKIEVLGPGCPRCFELERRTRRAVEELGVDVHIEKIADIQKIIPYRILATPGLVVDGKVKCSGRVPSADEIKAWIREAAAAAPAEAK